MVEAPPGGDVGHRHLGGPGRLQLGPHPVQPLVAEVLDRGAAHRGTELGLQGARADAGDRDQVGQCGQVVGVGMDVVADGTYDVRTVGGPAAVEQQLMGTGGGQHQAAEHQGLHLTPGHAVVGDQAVVVPLGDHEVEGAQQSPAGRSGQVDIEAQLERSVHGPLQERGQVGLQRLPRDPHRDLLGVGVPGDRLPMLGQQHGRAPSAAGRRGRAVGACHRAVAAQRDVDVVPGVVRRQVDAGCQSVGQVADSEVAALDRVHPGVQRRGAVGGEHVRLIHLRDDVLGLLRIAGAKPPVLVERLVARRRC